jgi:hypothetical protein
VTVQSTGWAAWREINVLGNVPDTYRSLSYGLPAANVTANSTYTTFLPKYVVDGNVSAQGWIADCCIPVAGDPNSHKWIQIDLGATARVAGVDLVVDQSPSGPTEHRVQYSNDNVNFTTATTIATTTYGGDILRPRVAFSARYVRILTVQSTGWVAWKEINVLGNGSTTPKDTNPEKTFRANLNITADDRYDAVYIGETLLTDAANADWQVAESWGTYAGVGTVVAIQVSNTLGFAGLLASLNYKQGNLGTDATWRCTATPPSIYWYKMTYDDSAWPAATEKDWVGSGPWGRVPGSRTSSQSMWIWAGADTNQAVW